MSRHDPLTPDELAVMDAVRSRHPTAWRSIVLRVWDGQLPTGTARLLGDEGAATLQRMKRTRGTVWLGSYKP